MDGESKGFPSLTRDHYQLLGVARNADRRTIRAAYRKSLRHHHPDANAGSRAGEQILLQVITAGRILSNPELRARYDQQLTDRPIPQAVQPTIKKSTEQINYKRLLLGWLKLVQSGAEVWSRFFSAERATVTEARAAQQRRRTPPAFSFYLFQAINRRNRSEYQLGDDGVYRKCSHPLRQTKSKSWRNRTAVWLLIGIMLWRI